jgi:hypothetical protein
MLGLINFCGIKDCKRKFNRKIILRYRLFTTAINRVFVG